jgi:hypothetical protein
VPQAQHGVKGDDGAGYCPVVRPELQLFAEWAPACLLDDRPPRGRRHLADAFEQLARRAADARVGLRLHWAWPLLHRSRQPIPLGEYARLEVRLASLGVRLSLWPLVERRRGYFLGPRTAALFASRLWDLEIQLGRAGLATRVGLTLDLEPPLPVLLRRWVAPLDPADPDAQDRLLERLVGLREAGLVERLQAAVVPGTTPPAALDDILVMAYGSMPDVTGRLERAYPIVSSLLCAVGTAGLRFGPRRRRTVMALGLLNHGVLWTEPTFTSASTFARAVERTHGAGDADLAVYGLCGLLCGPEGLVTPDPEVRDLWDPIAPRRVRGEDELDEWITPLVGRIAARRDRGE